MTDGEGREHFHFLESDGERGPISALYRAPGQGEDTGDEVERGSTWTPVPESTRAQGSSGRDPTPDLASDDEELPPYPALAPVVFFCMKQTTRPRSWCLRMVCNPYPLHNVPSLWRPLIAGGRVRKALKCVSKCDGNKLHYLNLTYFAMQDTDAIQRVAGHCIMQISNKYTESVVSKYAYQIQNFRRKGASLNG